MSKPKRAPDMVELQRQHARCAQLEAIQMLLFTMDALGERSATFQMEFEGVLENLIIKRCTQLELDEFVKSELAAQGGCGPRSGPRPPDRL